MLILSSLALKVEEVVSRVFTISEQKPAIKCHADQAQLLQPPSASNFNLNMSCSFVYQVTF